MNQILYVSDLGAVSGDVAGDARPVFPKVVGMSVESPAGKFSVKAENPMSS